ncbi:hypothetical protein [Arsukibacterium indicum]|uniref:Solute-binding protein family 3/N-terminal domain-containing protein n=1 Tax=Arsukibacterium indicum TaxID=2848612 RepID=A0ABS6MK61_9GAMM|nr:hypothetical protein [Arsukibacterium indicum]MBV2129217.1 hypothetical protein [Arsukibacterium indicum]
MGIKTGAFLTLCCLMWHDGFATSDADNNAGTISSQTINLSYVSHPVVETVLLPLIRSAYQNIRVEVKFTAVETERGLRLLQDGMVDGDVARTGQVLAKLDNVITVAKLAELKLELHCRPGVQCKLNDLTDPEVLLFFPESARTLKELDLQITAQKYHLRDWSQLIAMYDAGKVDRFLWISSSLDCASPVANTTVVAIPTAPIDLYHVIHASKLALLEPLKSAINNELELLIAGRCH